jgi:hypothetical protein
MWRVLFVGNEVFKTETFFSFILAAALLLKERKQPNRPCEGCLQ